MAHAARQARLAVMLGGEHTASLGGFRGIKRVYPDAVILQADAHLDMRPDYEGQAFTHATWLNHVGAGVRLRRSFTRSACGRATARSGSWRAAAPPGAAPSSACPTSVRERIGQSPGLRLDRHRRARSGARAGHGLSRTRRRDVPRACRVPVRPGGAATSSALDVMEVSPNLDPANITAAAAAKLVREAISVRSDARRPGSPP